MQDIVLAKLRTGIVALLLPLAAACSAGGSMGGAEAEVTGPCADRAARLGAMLDGLRGEDTLSAVVEVDDFACGRTFHASSNGPVDAHGYVRIGSISKTYVAIVILGLVEEGRIALDETLGAYLAVPEAFEGLTVRQLLNHTSGAFSYTENPAFWSALEAEPGRRWKPSELLDLAVSEAPYFAPGAGWRYSNTNYVLLGLLAEHIGGASIATLIRARILEPNGLRETFFGEPEGALIPGYDADGNDVSRTFDPSCAWASGALVATPSDVARFLRLVGTGALLPPSLQRELTTGAPTPQPGLSYGLGVFLASEEATGVPGVAIGHGGDIFGYHSTGFYFSEQDVTVAGAMTKDGRSGNEILAGVLGIVFASQPRLDDERVRLR